MLIIHFFTYNARQAARHDISDSDVNKITLMANWMQKKERTKEKNSQKQKNNGDTV